MLSGGLDGLYRSLLVAGHRATNRIEVWSQGVRIDTFGDAGLPITAGTLSATLTSRVARTVSLNTYERFYPNSPGDLLAPYGNQLKIFSGVYGYGGQDYEWQTFFGRIDDVGLDDTGNVTLNAVDQAGGVQDSFFTTPQQSNTALNIADQFVKLVSAALADATFGTFDQALVFTPNLIWQTDRASACDQLATAANMFWYPLANGDFVLRFVAWDTSTAPLLTLSDGPRGFVQRWNVTRTRRNVYNAPTVVGERSDGSDPVFGSATDGDPTSPTYIGGKFGVKGKLISVQTVDSTPQAQQVARTYLHSAKALTEQWAITCFPDPSIELGDPFVIQGGTRLSSTQIVTSFTLPLVGNGMMSIAFRAQTPGATEEFAQ